MPLPRPQCHILLVVPDTLLRRSLHKGLSTAARQMDNPCGLSFDAVGDAQAALARAHADGDLQSLLIDAAGGEGWTAEALVRELHALRPELDLYLLVDPDHRDALTPGMDRESIDGYFIRDEADPRGWFRILQAEIQEKSRTPFFDALRDYVLMAKDA